MTYELRLETSWPYRPWMDLNRPSGALEIRFLYWHYMSMAYKRYIIHNLFYFLLIYNTYDPTSINENLRRNVPSVLKLMSWKMKKIPKLPSRSYSLLAETTEAPTKFFSRLVRGCRPSSEDEKTTTWDTGTDVDRDAVVLLAAAAGSPVCRHESHKTTKKVTSNIL